VCILWSGVNRLQIQEICYDPVVRKITSRCNYAPVAQLVEQGPFKPKVVGSNPARRTNVESSALCWGVCVVRSGDLVRILPKVGS
jgi:hypothetical protein